MAPRQIQNRHPPHTMIGGLDERAATEEPKAEASSRRPTAVQAGSHQPSTRRAAEAGRKALAQSDDGSSRPSRPLGAG
ncbi:hypothetical protein E2562_034175 [Oryza meyeriana var. granulata]|uniref:Uncharacterized protein n=1 Tax=Oryza meyeriana var. granulata TaxID=110450 RepID=A0A6G1ESB6_9ORYZ|nr:hypothetical protein E2562_034175 [Oryza meyeriana var. granulata]